jgi:hypothetical protein
VEDLTWQRRKPPSPTLLARRLDWPKRDIAAYIAILVDEPENVCGCV